MDGLQSRMARAALGFGVRDLAARAGISPGSVVRIEAAGPAVSRVTARTCAAVRRGLEDAGAVFGTDGSVRIAQTTNRSDDDD
jgi:hypothetical protein